MTTAVPTVTATAPTAPRDRPQLAPRERTERAAHERRLRQAAIDRRIAESRVRLHQARLLLGRFP